MKMLRRFSVVFFAIAVCLPLWAVGQSVTGVPGYVRIPSATFNKDGTMWFGTSFLPRQHLPYSNYRYDALAAYVGVTFLSFIEIDLRVTRQLNIPEGWHHVVDRVPSVRFRILKERKWVPALAVGLHDIITSLESGAARHFGASYLVLSKNFHIKPLQLNMEATGGWGAKKFIWKNNEFIGFFGGILLTFDKIKWMNLVCDYDGTDINAGLQFVCFKHLYVTAATMGFDSFTGTLSYRFNLIR